MRTRKSQAFFASLLLMKPRIFVNLNDYYPDAEEPPYFNPCHFQAPLASGTRGNRSLLNSIYKGFLRFYDYNRGGNGRGAYIMVTANCGDCTVLGSNKKTRFLDSLKGTPPIHPKKEIRWEFQKEDRLRFDAAH